MKTYLEDALVLEMHKGKFETDDGKVYPFNQGRVYIFGQEFPGLEKLSVPNEKVAEFESLVGKKHNLECDLQQRYGKIKLTFLGAA